MPNKVAIVCHSEPLPQYTAGRLYFGVSFALMFESPVDAATWSSDVDKYLLPWNLGELDDVQAWVLNGGAWSHVVGRLVPPTNIVDLDALRNVVLESNLPNNGIRSNGLRKRILDLKTRSGTPNTAAFTIPSTGDIVDGRMPDEQGGDAQSLAGMLGSVSQQNAAVAMALRLSYVVSFNEADLAGVSQIAIAPEFKRGNVAQAPFTNLGPDDTKQPTAPGGDVLRLEYKSTPTVAGAPSYAGYVRPTPKTLSQAANSFIDPSLWIANAGGHFSVDWMPKFRANLPLVFDLMQRMIDAYRRYGQRDPDHPDQPFGAQFNADVAWYMRRSLLATSRDGAGTGVALFAHEMSARGDNPIDVRLDLAGEILESAHRNAKYGQGVVEPTRSTLRVAMRAALVNYKPSLAQWCDILVKAFPQLQGNSALTRALDANSQSGPTLSLNLLPDEIAQWEVVQSLIADDRNARTLLLKQWELAATAAQGDALTYWQKFSVAGQGGLALSDLLEEFHVRQRQLAEVAEFSWRSLLPRSGNIAARIASNIKTSLQEYLTKRVHTSPPAVPYDLFLPETGATPPSGGGADHPVVAAVKAELNRAVDEFVAKFVPSPGMEVSPTPTPHPIVVAVESMNREPSGDSNHDDTSAAFAGVGLLMRETSNQPKPWSVLNLAEIHFSDPSHLTIPGPRVLDSGIIPIPLSYQEQVRQVAVAYNNRPLAAFSPLSTRRDEFALQHEDGLYDAPNMFDLGVPSDPMWGILPMLKYGRSYEAAGFAICNCGALPKELVLGGGNMHPSLLALNQSQELLQPSPGSPLDRAIHRDIVYKRRVPVGPPRLFDGGAQPTLISKYPAGVVPIVEELRHAGMDSSKDAPFLLLWKGSNNDNASVSFSVMLPSTDMDNWQRWVAADDPGPIMGTRDKLIKVWAAFLQLTPKMASGTDNPQRRRPLLPDDPAVLPKYRAVISVMDLTAGFTDLQAQVFPQTIPLGPEPGLDFGDLALAMTQSVKVVVSVNQSVQTPQLNYDEALKVLSVLVPEGVVARLRLQAIVDDSKASRFATLNGLEQIANGPLLTPPSDILIETAIKTLPLSPRDVYDAIAPRLEGRKLIVALKPAELKRSLFRNVSEVLLQTQVWNWDGIRVDPFPVDKLDDINALYAWDARGFGRRPDTDSAYKTGRWRFGPGETILDSEDLTNDLRALYYRYAVLVKSRYSDLYPNENAEVTSRTSQSPIADPMPDPRRPVVDRWRRYLVPPQVRPTLPKPQVRLIVPLTQQETGSMKPASGMLIVTEDVAYETGGILESLEARVDWPAVSFKPDDFKDWASGPLFALRNPGAQFPLLRNKALQGLSPKTHDDVVNGDAGTPPTDQLKRQVSVELTQLTNDAYFSSVQLEMGHSSAVVAMSQLLDSDGKGLTQLPNSPAAFAMVAEAVNADRVLRRALEVAIPEIGHDPTIDNMANTQQLVNIVVDPPAGYTMDDTRLVAPLIRRSAYMAAIDGADAMTMAKVGFRKRIRVSGRTQDDMVGPLTEGVWTQLLPNADLFQDKNVSSLSLSRENGGPNLRHSGIEGDRFRTMLTGLSGKRITSHWLLLSHKATNAWGQEGNEAYEALYGYQGSMIWTPMREDYALPPVGPQGSRTLVARILKISQRVETVLSAGDPTLSDILKDRRFMTQREPDVDLRITSDNKPLESRLDLTVPFVQVSTAGALFVSLVSTTGTDVKPLIKVDYIQNRITGIASNGGQSAAIPTYVGRGHWIKIRLIRASNSDTWTITSTIGDGSAAPVELAQTGVRLPDGYFVRVSATMGLAADYLPSYFGAEPWEYLFPPYSDNDGRHDAVAMALPMSQPILFD